MLCSVGGIRDMGLAVLDALEAQEISHSEVEYLQAQAQLAEGVRASELRAYHRQWWLMVPLGLLAGVTLTLTVQLLLAR